MKTCDHRVVYVLDFANQIIPLRPDGCLLCERDELESKLHDTELARDALHAGLKAVENRLSAALTLLREGMVKSAIRSLEGEVVERL